MKIEQILQETKNKNWREKLIFVAENFNDITFSSSFSIEDQVIVDFIATNNLPIAIFTIDTGRLPQETYNVWQNTLEKYKIKISAFYPDALSLENFITQTGINSFYESKDFRLSCCEIRKVEPLKRALKNKKLWISGLRKQHSNLRAQKDSFEFDKNLQIIKFYPLLESSEEELWQEINQNRIPFNRLYKVGYKSIGCTPCSRAIQPHDDIRAGRWWWENSDSKECGLHKIN
jgi:phosphoadenosine phosphosulfate reductase